MTTITPKVYQLLERCVEDGVDYGYMRAHKHCDAPTEASLKDNIQQAVMNEICEWFDFPQNNDEQ